MCTVFLANRSLQESLFVVLATLAGLAIFAGTRRARAAPAAGVA